MRHSPALLVFVGVVLIISSYYVPEVVEAVVDIGEALVGR